MKKYKYLLYSILFYGLQNRRSVMVERLPRMREVGVQSPFGTVKTGSDCSTAKSSATGVSVTGHQKCPLYTGKMSTCV